MSSALATTKRKFHKLLDSISNASTPSLVSQHDKANQSTSTLPANFAPPSKRLRVERPKSAFIPSKKSVDSLRTRHRSLLPQAQRPTTPQAKEDRKPPNFAPWDRNQFLERLKTFRHVDKWLGKPGRINEVQWAKRGWSCVGRNTVRCLGGCEVSIVIKVEEDPLDTENQRDDAQSSEGDDDGDDDGVQDWREAAQKELVERYAEMISSAHEGGCLWRRRGCDDTIQRLPLIHHATALQGLRDRYNNLTSISSELPSESTFSIPEGLSIPTLIAQASQILQPPPETTTPHPSPVAINTPALLLSLFGWQTEESGHLPGLVTCNACFRRLGLWLYRSSSTSSGATHEESSPLPHLDLVTEHRDYCPWVSALSQNGMNRRTSLDSLAGWEVLVRGVRNAARRRDEEADEAGEGEGGETSGREDGGHPLTRPLIPLTPEEEKARDEERKSRLKRLKQVFSVGKRKEGA